MGRIRGEMGAQARREKFTTYEHYLRALGGNDLEKLAITWKASMKVGDKKTGCQKLIPSDSVRAVSENNIYICHSA